MRVYHLLNVENGMSNIALRRIRVSRVRELNDPFELFAARADNGKFQKGLQESVDEFNRNQGLLCFSKRWRNPVLWSHYASKHRGVCLGLDVADELLKDVHYTTDRIPPKFVDDNPDKGPDERFVRDLLYTKYEHWRYEEETRAFIALDHSTIEDGSYYYPFDNSLLLGEVILGPLCEIPIDRVRELVRSVYEHVSVIKARLAYKWFEVVADECSVREENAYWEQMGLPPPYTLSGE